jgi:AcrR family transcriptional regulator
MQPGMAEQQGKVRTPQQRRSREKKRRMVEAAAGLFAERGYSRTTSKDIALHAGVSVGTFYSYFKNKRELLVEVAALHNEELERTVRERMGKARDGTGRELTRGIVLASHAAHNLSPEFHREAVALGLTDARMRRLRERSDAAWLEMTRRFLQAHAARLRVADLDAAARVVTCTVEGVVHGLVFGGGQDDAPRILEELADELARYLFTDPDAAP